MRFKKVVSIDYTGLEEMEKAKLAELAEEVIYFDDCPTTEAEIIKRIDDADCVLVSWNTHISGEVMEQCPNIKYIGMCCSLYDEESANVDIAAAREQGIIVYGVSDYGDEGVMEFIISELVCLLHGLGEHHWTDEILELSDQKLGIIGLGTTGIMLAERAKAFGMDIYYYSRTRKIEIEERLGIKYLEKEAVLKQVDIISTHVPRNTVVLDAEDIRIFGNNKIIINTSLGPTFDLIAFAEWITTEGNYAIFDQGGLENTDEQLTQYERVIYSKHFSGFTRQARRRLSVKVLENIEKYFAACIGVFVE